MKNASSSSSSLNSLNNGELDNYYVTQNYKRRTKVKENRYFTYTPILIQIPIVIITSYLIALKLSPEILKLNQANFYAYTLEKTETNDDMKKILLQEKKDELFQQNQKEILDKRFEMQDFTNLFKKVSSRILTTIQEIIDEIIQYLNVNEVFEVENAVKPIESEDIPSESLQSDSEEILNESIHENENSTEEIKTTNENEIADDIEREIIDTIGNTFDVAVKKKKDYDFYRKLLQRTLKMLPYDPRTCEVICESLLKKLDDSSAISSINICLGQVQLIYYAQLQSSFNKNKKYDEKNNNISLVSIGTYLDAALHYFKNVTANSPWNAQARSYLGTTQFLKSLLMKSTGQSKADYEDFLFQSKLNIDAASFSSSDAISKTIQNQNLALHSIMQNQALQAKLFYYKSNNLFPQDDINLATVYIELENYNDAFLLLRQMKNDLKCTGSIESIKKYKEKHYSNNECCSTSSHIFSMQNDEMFDSRRIVLCKSFLCSVIYSNMGVLYEAYILKSEMKQEKQYWLLWHLALKHYELAMHYNSNNVIVAQNYHYLKKYLEDKENQDQFLLTVLNEPQHDDVVKEQHESIRKMMKSLETSRKPNELYLNYKIFQMKCYLGEYDAATEILRVFISISESRSHKFINVIDDMMNMLLNTMIQGKEQSSNLFQMKILDASIFAEFDSTLHSVEKMKNDVEDKKERMNSNILEKEKKYQEYTLPKHKEMYIRKKMERLKELRKKLNADQEESKEDNNHDRSNNIALENEKDNDTSKSESAPKLKEHNATIDKRKTEITETLSKSTFEPDEIQSSNLKSPVLDQNPTSTFISMNNKSEEYEEIELLQRDKVFHKKTSNKTKIPSSLQANKESNETASENVSEMKDQNQTHSTTESRSEMARLSEDDFILPDLYIPLELTFELTEEEKKRSKAYLKLADAHMSKKNYNSASREFLKVIKINPYSLQGYIGYATSLEKQPKYKNKTKIAEQYTNAAKVVLTYFSQDKNKEEQFFYYGRDGVKCGTNNGGLAESLLRKAINIILEAKMKLQEKVSLLTNVAESAHTAILAADTYYQIGAQMLLDLGPRDKWAKNNNTASAMQYFETSNKLMQVHHSNPENLPILTVPNYHSKSLIELGFIEYFVNRNITASLHYLEKGIADEYFQVDLIMKEEASRVIKHIKDAWNK